MKTASKVFLIIGMVILPFYTLLLFVAKDAVLEYFVQDDKEIMGKALTIVSIAMAIYSVISIVVGILAIQKLKTAKNRNELVPLGIVSIFLVSLFGGIFMLCVKDEELNAGHAISMSEIPATTRENPNQNQK